MNILETTVTQLLQMELQTMHQNLQAFAAWQENSPAQVEAVRKALAQQLVEAWRASVHPGFGLCLPSRRGDLEARGGNDPSLGGRLSLPVNDLVDALVQRGMTDPTSGAPASEETVRRLVALTAIQDGWQVMGLQPLSLRPGPKLMALIEDTHRHLVMMSKEAPSGFEWTLSDLTHDQVRAVLAEAPNAVAFDASGRILFACGLIELIDPEVREAAERRGPYEVSGYGPQPQVPTASDPSEAPQTSGEPDAAT